MGLDLAVTEAPCDTPEFPAGERVRIHLTAALESGAYWLNPLFFPRHLKLVAAYGLGRSFFVGLSAALRINFKMLLHKARRPVRRRVEGAA